MPKLKSRRMHPRNIFCVRPDYTALAIKYNDFLHVCKLELSGKVSIDYKQETALRALTQTLLKEYFDLVVDFAPGSLVPTLPLRLNYIHWMEDLVKPLKEDQVRGIDIGCGSACIYALLAAKMNNWQMIALETCNDNVEYAQRNVERNELKKMITIVQLKDKEQIFRDFLNNTDINYSFCLCNPPFYDSALADPFNSTTRNPTKRAPPHNCRTGREEELTCDGGEVQFVRQIIKESVDFANRICIFTSMLGRKTSLFKIIEILEEKGIKNFCSTEFCQGNTTRWGIAWSFRSSVALSTP